MGNMMMSQMGASASTTGAPNMAVLAGMFASMGMGNGVFTLADTDTDTDKDTDKKWVQLQYAALFRLADTDANGLQTVGLQHVCFCFCSASVSSKTAMICVFIKNEYDMKIGRINASD